MIARALPATITNAVSAINKGVLFVTTSPLRPPSINVQILSLVQNEPAKGREAAGLLRQTFDAFRFGLFGPANVWSYPTFPPPPRRVSYLIQIPKAIRLKVNRC